MQTRNSILLFIAITIFITGAVLALWFVITPSQLAPSPEPSMDLNVHSTSVVQTVLASLSQTQAASNSFVTSTPQPTITLPPVALNSPAPTATFQQVFVPPAPTIFLSPTITGTVFTPTTNPSNLAVGCNNLRLIRDETIPAGTVVRPGESFTKTWKVENNGTCDWVFLYRLVFTGGERMEGDSPSLGKIIVPGKWTQLSVALTAPSKAGTYVGYWRLGTQSGSPFGATLTVSIVVGNPTDTPAPTATSTSTPTAPPTATPVSYP